MSFLVAFIFKYSIVYFRIPEQGVHIWKLSCLHGKRMFCQCMPVLNLKRVHDYMLCNHRQFTLIQCSVIYELNL